MSDRPQRSRTEPGKEARPWFRLPREGRRRRPGATKPLSPWARRALVALLVVLGGLGTFGFVRDARQTDWSVAGAVWAAHVVGALAVGTLLALVLDRRVRDPDR